MPRTQPSSHGIPSEVTPAPPIAPCCRSLMRLSSPNGFDHPFQEETAMTMARCSEPSPSHLWQAGPVASPINWFVARLAEQGEAPCTAQETLRLGTPLRPWLQK